MALQVTASEAMETLIRIVGNVPNQAIWIHEPIILLKLFLQYYNGIIL